MFQTLVRFFTTKEVRNKIFFTLAMLVIFKIGTYIPLQELILKHLTIHKVLKVPLSY